jgi:subtilisin-like proprotein convertase family protein
VGIWVFDDEPARAARKAKRGNLAGKRPRPKSRRGLLVEPLEQRVMLAISPTLTAIIPNDGDVVLDGQTRNIAPKELTFRFSDGQTIDPATLASGIQIVRSGGDGVYGNGNDSVIVPGFIGIGVRPNEVIVRFADTLIDDFYRITVVGAGPSPLKNSTGDVFNSGVNKVTNLRLDLPPEVTAVVPQPITRDAAGNLVQAKNKVEVYFNTDKLNIAAAQNPVLYRLIDTQTGRLLLPKTATYTASQNKVVLTFDGDLPQASFHLQIGVSEESNDTLGSAIDVGTISQRAEFKVYQSPVVLDQNGDPVPPPINDNQTTISQITIGDAFLVQDLNVQLNIDHAWGPDLRVFLIGPNGDRVELVRDLGSDVRGGQIYGTKFDDLDGNGTQDANEPGLAGWTVFLDDNNNSVLDPGERSTVTDAAGNYAFVGLAIDKIYTVAEVPQDLWRQSTPTVGGSRTLVGFDFSNGANQVLRIVPDPVNGNPTSGTFTLGFSGRETAPIAYTGPNATTAANIQQALQSILDPGDVVAVQLSSSNPIQFQISFTRNGIATPVDHDIIAVVNNSLNRGSMAVDTQGSADGFTSTGPLNQWHLSVGRGGDPGHSGQQSFYFGANETATGGGSYQDDPSNPNLPNGTLISPVVDLRSRSLTAPLFLELNHFLSTEQFFDFAKIEVVDAAGQRTTLLNTDVSTAGFQALSFNISQFAGKEIHFEFTFDSDSSVTFEGWYVDDIRVVERPGVHTVTLSSLPQGSIAKDVNFGAFRTELGPDEFGYRAFAVTPEFEDIFLTGQRTFQDYLGTGFAVQAGGPGAEEATSVARDAAGNLYVTGSFQATANFGPNLSAPSLTSAGSNDIFLAKYDDTGALLWVQRIGGTGNDVSNDVQVDAAGNVVITGAFSGTVDFDPGAGTSNLISAGGTDIFVAKFDSGGNLVWAQRAGGTGADVGEGLAVAEMDKLIVTGSFSGTENYGSVPGGPTLTSAGGTDIFVIVVDSAGNHLNGVSFGAAANDAGRAVAVDSMGNVAVTGSFTGSVDFDPSMAVAQLNSNGSTDGFVLQLTLGGAFRWVRQLGGAQADAGAGVAVDSMDNVIVAGGVNNDAAVAKYSSDGTQLWLRQFGSLAIDTAEDVAVDVNDQIYVTGGFRGTVDFDPGPGTLEKTSRGGVDAFVARFTPQGDLNLARTSGGTQDDTGRGIVVADDAYYVGSFRLTSDFDVGPNFVSQTSAGTTDAFLAKLTIVFGQDDATRQLTAADLAGFKFKFYGQLYQELFFSSNGLITFGSADSSGANTDLTSLPPQAAVIPFWRDLATGTGDTEAVFWEVRGTGDDQRLIIQWNNVQLAGALAGLGSGPINFQAVLRESDNSIQFNYQTINGPILIDTESDRSVGTFVKGLQDKPSVAVDAAGNYVVVWTAPDQDGDQGGIFARRYDPMGNPLPNAGNPLGDEFQINTTTVGDQIAPRVAMAPDGRFVVVWQTTGGELFARLFDAAGDPLLDPAGNPLPEFMVNATTAGTQTAPAMEMDANGNFVVTWGGNGPGDGSGVFFRRFDSTGQPLDFANEVQRLRILGPPAAGSTFTLSFGGNVTGNISFAGAAQPAITALSMQNALRALPNLSDSVVVTPLAVDEVQTINFSPTTTGGTFVLSFGGQMTAPITFAGPASGAATAANIQTALRNLPNIGNTTTVTSQSGFAFTVNFLGVDGGINQPPLILKTNNLNPSGATLTVTEAFRGGGTMGVQEFDVDFLGPDGGIDQPLLVQGNRLGGVTHIEISEVVKGTSGERLANTFVTGVQAEPSIARDAAGGFVITWRSAGQDLSGNGVFAKRFDANGVAQPGDIDEMQRIELLGPPVPGSTYRLGFGGQTTGVINYTGDNAIDAISIQTALRNLPNLGNTLTVVPAPGMTDEVQLISFLSPTPNNPTPTGGTFQLSHAGLFTGPITFAGPGAANGLTTAANIQAELILLPGLAGVTVVPATPNNDRQFLVTFAGPPVGGVDQPLMFLLQNNLTPAGVTGTITERQQGGASATDFVVTFNGVDGRRDQPSITLADNTGGVVNMNTVTLVEGSDSEFLVPDNTLGDQQSPAIAWLPNANFLAVWTSPDGDGTGIVGKLFDPTGNPLGPEFPVNAITEGDQSQPQVIIDAAGNFVVTWTSADQEANGVFARPFTVDGIPVGDEFQVNDLTSGNQQSPAIALLPSGNFIVAWPTQAGEGGIHSRRFQFDGTPIDAQEVQVSQLGLPEQDAPVVARNAAGDYVVAWTDTLRDPLIDAGVYVQVFDASGMAKTSEIPVNVSTDLGQSLPDVAIDDAGNFVVVWQTEVATPQGNNNFDVVARRFLADGTPATGEIAVSVNTVNDQIIPRVALTPAGGFVVTWESTVQDGDGEGIFARRFDAGGQPLDAQEFRVNTTTAGDQVDPAIDADASGNFVIVWSTHDAVGNNAIFAQRYDAAGQAVGLEFRIDDDSMVFADFPDVAIDAAGRFIVSWWGDVNIVARQFDADGKPLTGIVDVSDVGTNFLSTTRISTGPDGQTVIVWDPDSDDILAQRFSANFVKIGANVVINDFTTGLQFEPSVAMGPSNEFIVAWLDLAQGGSRVLVNQLTTDNPSVGIKDAGPQTAFTDLLPIWTDGANNPFVGTGLSTLVATNIAPRQRVFAADGAAGMIRELNPDSGAVIRSLPMPGGAASGDGSLAYAGNTLYYVAPGGTKLFELDQKDGAIVDEILLSDLGITAQVRGLAYLNGQLVALTPSTGTLHFIDTYSDQRVRSVATGLSLQGGLAGAGSRGTLYVLQTNGRVAELNATTGVAIRSFLSPQSQATGLAVVDGQVWVGTAAGNVSVLNATTGAIITSFTTGLSLSALGGDDGGAIKQSLTSIFQPLQATVLDDEATTPITAGVGPYTGSYVPVEPLNVFDNRPVTGVWQLEVQDTATGDVGTIQGWKLIVNQPDQTPPDYQASAFIGDNIAKGANDVDLYRFSVLQAGSLRVNTAPGATLDSVIRVFNSSGVQLGLGNTAGLGAPDQLIVSLPAAGTYYIGISSNGNTVYAPATGANATGGASTGNYLMDVRFEKPVGLNNDNSTLAQATNLGTLGQGGLSPYSTVAGIPYLLNFPGGINEIGHRDIPVPGENHFAPGATPDQTQGITTLTYDFRTLYGVDPQGKPLSNVITEAQKERAREIFALWGYYTGVNFVEKTDVDTTGVFADFGIVTGDPRAIDPTAPTGRGGVYALSNDSLAVMDNAENWGNSEFGGDWFQVAMHEVGKMLGLGNAYDLPSFTIMGNEGEANPTPAEGIFPGGADVINGQYLYRPESRDVDLYRFDVTTSGRFSAEIVAERMVDSSLLDSVLTLFDSTGKIIARNDDYFSKDSFLDLDLVAGRYYIGVSSTGNTNYSPIVPDSGMGGTTEGAYQLRLNFSRTPSGSLLVDTTGTVLDGDRDGVPGGTFNFWFNVGNASNTIYVDKVAPTAGADGSLAKPYNNIAVALAAATPGGIVRVVGNGGADGNLDTLGDNRAYEIGYDDTITPSVPLSDGTSLDVPQNVTLMIDAGAIFKLSEANINAGSFSQGVDLAGGAIQVLGTPLRSAIFTSYHNEQIGVDTNPRPTTPKPGDWGGLVFRHDSDHETQGIFLNYVAYANIGFGGGSVVVDSVKQTFSPLHLEKARPTLVSNVITGSADAAISADPDSFEESLFRDDTSNLLASVRFAGDYRRVGPDIHSNTLIGNSVNGLFVRIRTEFGQPVDKLTVSGRFDDTDIVHVVAENLFIQGTPGGPTLRSDGTYSARTDAQLVVDPGIIVKMQGSRIEVELGAQLVAEGRAQTQVVFTSLSDDRYGAGGVFDTTNDGGQSTPAAGDWGGIYFHPTSKGSIDRALITFAGGDTPIEGGFANFSAVEIHQADVRITNSILEHNDDGFVSAIDRNGRGTNAASTIFVRGAQPIIINNIIRDNRGDVISIDADSMTADLLGDRGRSTGAIDRFTTFDDNHGPLVQDNKLQDNEVNGMGVRSATNKANIEFRFGSGAVASPAAVAALEQAAAMWEAVLKDPITVVIDVDLLGLTPSGPIEVPNSVRFSAPYDLIRQLMIDDAQRDDTLVYQLPTFAQLQVALPPNVVLSSNMAINRANLLALGIPPSQLITSTAPVSQYDNLTPIDGSLIFNSDRQLDFDPSNGIAAGSIDFVGVAVREIGHILGFQSWEDDLVAGAPVALLQPLDLFRMEAGDGFANFTFATRMLDYNAPFPVFYDGGEFNRPDITFKIVPRLAPRPPGPLFPGDIPLSRGTNPPGWPASHWLDNNTQLLAGIISPIGVMDPNFPLGDYGTPITEADIRAFNLIGYDTSADSVGITTETIWDDTDIVHVVREEIPVPNFSTSGGLRLQSSPTESLVIKLDGENAGFTSSGEKLDINDRIGGTLQVLGTPGHPVVMTSLEDNTVGAGVDLAGQPQTQTVLTTGFVVGPTVNTSHMRGNQTEATIAIDPTSPNRVFVASNPDSLPGLMVTFSADGGATWTSRVIADGTDGLPLSTGDPSANWDSFGNLFLSYLDVFSNPNRAQVVVTVSLDGGRTFNVVDRIDADDQPTITTGPSDIAGVGSVWVNFELNGTINVAGAYVTGLGGVTNVIGPGVTVPGFGPTRAVPLPGNLPLGQGVNFGDIAIGPQGQVIVTYQTSGSGEGPTTIYTNIDPDGFGQAPFGPALTVTASNVGSEDLIPAEPEAFGTDAEAGLAWDRSGGSYSGRLYLVYTDELIDESNDTDIFLRISDDSGATWSAPRRINDDATPNSQFLPRIAVDQTTGDVAITWHDARNDSGFGVGTTNATPNDDTQFWGTFSQNGGQTFVPNFQISAGTSTENAGEPPAPGLRDINYGDYTGLDFYGGSFYPAWADSSPELPNNPSPPQFEIATARVTVPSIPRPGSWRGIVLDEYTNDRNVDVVNELEAPYTGTGDANNLPSKAQFLGTLAPDGKNGDDNRRLGFDVHGFVSFDRPGDVDVYSFNGQAGTEIWLDIDRTSASLDTVVELIDANGTLLARSDNSVDETANPSLLVGSATVKPMTMQKTLFSGEDSFTTNPKDAGMRLVLPGVVGTTNTYYVRVRSSSANLANPVGGLTSGGYQLQIRLRELDEVAGSTVRYADIRYASTGIEVLGGPAHSPLTGEIGRAGGNTAAIVAQDLGDILASDRATISLSARQDAATEVQWYKFAVDYHSIQSIFGLNSGPKTMALTFDVDYADGLARPDLTLALFEEVDPTVNGLQFIALARSSDVPDDQPPPLGGSGANDLSRGSFGKLDPFLGSIQLQEGDIRTYYVAITSDAMLPALLAGLNTAEPDNKLVRLEPLNSVKRIVEDHIGSVGYVTGDPMAMPPHMVLPSSGPVLPIDPMGLPNVVDPYTLGDIVLYVSTGGNLAAVNSGNGQLISGVGGFTGRPMGDIAIRTDGYMFGVQGAPQADQDQNAGQLVNINPGTAGLTLVGEDHIVNMDPTNPTPEQLTASTIDAMAYQRFDINGQPGQNDGNSEHYGLFYSVHGPTGSVLYFANATDGEGANDSEIWGPVSGDAATSVITGVNGYTTGMAFVGGTLYGVSDGGDFYTINPQTGAATLITSYATQFAGLSAGPLNLDGGALANSVFVITTAGEVAALDTATGSLMPVFDDVNMDGAPDQVLNTGIGGATGLALSDLDFNLWHPTGMRSGPGNPGHGINAAHDNTRPADPGDTSFYFGLEATGDQFGNDPQLQGDLIAYFTGAQPRPAWLTNALFAQLQIGNNYNLPGGAHGNLITLPFNLEGSDVPVLYFNYYFRGNAGGDLPSVSVTVDGGANWTPLRINIFDAVTPGTEPVDDQFWRQARADLSQFTGEEEVQVRFEFASNISVNTLEGFYIDDIIVGSVARGEIATGPLTSLANPGVRPGNIDVNPTLLDIFIDPFTGEPLNPPGPDYAAEEAFVQVTPVPNPGNPSQVLTGAFQLEIRRSTEFAQIIDPITGTAEIFDQFNAADRLAQAFTLVAPEATALSVVLSTLSDGDTFRISDGVNPAITFEFDSNGSVTGTNVPVTFTAGATARDVTLAIEAAVNLVDALPNVPFNVHASHNGLGDALYLDGAVSPVTTVGVTFNLVNTILDGQFFTLSDGINQRTFEFDRDGKVAAGHIAIPIALESPQGVANRIRAAINAANSASFTVSASSKPTSDRVDLNNTANLSTSGTPGMGVLQFGSHTFYAAPGDQIMDGDTFTISDGFNRRVFEFDNDGLVTMGNIAIPFLGMESPSQIARLIFTAVNSQTGPTFLAFAQPPVAQRVDIARAISVSEDVNTWEFKAIEYNGLGDRNADVRDQGQIILQGNRITNSSQFGIAIDAGLRDYAGSHPGAVRNLRELNTSRLVTGVVVTNNIIANSGSAGILQSGDANDLGLYLAPVPFSRIVNNTIYGNGQGVGILVKDNSSPTILNNILADLNTGIQVSTNSSSTVVGANLYQGNASNTAGTTTGSFAIVLGPNDPLFVNAAAGNFNLAAGSRAIDSSLNSLADRPAMTTVSAPLGIGPSPILAPLTDLTGKLRVDDPSKPSEPGLGQNVFKDRGALDRSDFTGPTAALLNPLDNDASGTDQDPTLNTVLLAGQNLQNFSVRLIDDAGSGIDDSTVASGKFVLRRDGVVLVENVDYAFSYDSTNDIARFTPLQGVWLTDHVYTITLDNTAATGIKDLAGNRLLPNQAVNQTLFTIALKPVDFGDAPDPSYPTLLSSNGARHIIVPGFFLGAGVTAETNGQPSVSAAADLQDDGVQFTSDLRPGAVGTVTVTASAAGRLDAWIDFNGDGDWSDPGEQIFTNKGLVAGANLLTFNVSSAAVTSTYARFRFSSAGNLAPTGLANDGEVEDYQVDIPSIVAYSLVLNNAATGNELPKDAQGRYVALAGTTVQAQVYVDDLRVVGAAGGVQAAFADLAYDTDLIDWVANSLTIAADFATSSSGTILEGQQLIDEAGGVSTSAVPTGADPKRLLFTVSGQMKSNAPPGSTMHLTLNRADDVPAHETFVFGLSGVVPGTYQSVEVVVPQFAWQNPSQATDSKERFIGNLDVDNNGSIVGLDALLIINQLNMLPSYVDPITHALPVTPVAPNLPPFYVDVNGDGFLTSADALLVINYLNLIAAEALAGGGGGGGGAAAALRVANSTVDVSMSSAASSAPPDAAMNPLADGGPGGVVAIQPSTSGTDVRPSALQLAGIALAAHDTTAYSPASSARPDATSTAEATKLSAPSTPARIETSEKVGGPAGDAADTSDGLATIRLAEGLNARRRPRWDRAVADIFAKHSDRDDALALDDIVSWRGASHRQPSAGEDGSRPGQQG